MSYPAIDRSDWRDLIDLFRVVVRARTGQRIANKAARPACPACGRPDER